MNSFPSFSLAVVAVALLTAPAGLAVSIGQIDDFEDGTTQGWVVGLLGAAHPAPPANVPTGGPAGIDDNYLLLTSVGGGAAGSRLSVLNLSEWGGDYLALGVGGLTMDLRNLGGTDLSLRLLISDPTVGPPDNIAFSTEPVLLSAGGDWTSVFFPISAADMAPALGDVATALHHATELRIYHSAADAVPGEAIVAQLGVDNIQAAAATAVPEATSTIVLLGCGLLGLALAGGPGAARRGLRPI